MFTYLFLHDTCPPTSYIVLMDLEPTFALENPQILFFIN